MAGGDTSAAGWRGALKDAAGAGLVAAGLSFPILALRAEPNIDNVRVLQQRWSWLVAAAAIVFLGRLAMHLPGARAVARWCLLVLAAAVCALLALQATRLDAPPVARA